MCIKGKIYSNLGNKYFLLVYLWALLHGNEVSVGKFYQRFDFRYFVFCITSFLFYFDHPEFGNGEFLQRFPHRTSLISIGQEYQYLFLSVRYAFPVFRIFGTPDEFLFIQTTPSLSYPFLG